MLSTSAVGICKTTKINNVIIYIGARPSFGVSDIGENAIVPSPYPMTNNVNGKIATV